MKTQELFKGSIARLVLVVFLMLNVSSLLAHQKLFYLQSDSSSQLSTAQSLAIAPDFANNLNADVFLADAGESKSSEISKEPTLYYEDMEKGIQLEEWMLNSKHSFWKEAYVEAEDEIELEDWMLDASKW